MVKQARMSLNTLLTQLTTGGELTRAIAPMIIPPDGGWGWVIVLVGLLSACIVDGCVYCFYLYREPMSQSLNVKPGDIAYLSSINTGSYLFGAVLACSFANHWGFRLTMVIGAVLTSLCYASGSILQEIIYHYILVGALGGLGSGFITIGSNLPSGFYFDKKRSIALGIVSCGSGIGGMVMPTLLEMVMKHYGWRNAFLFEGGIVALLIFLGLLVRPLKPVMVVIAEDPTQANLRAREDSLLDFSAFRIPPLATTTPDPNFSFVSVRRSHYGETVQSTAQPTTMTTAQPRIAEMTEDISVVDIRVRDDTSNSNMLTRLHEMTQSRRGGLQPSASVLGPNNICISQESFIKRKLPWYKCGCCRSKDVTLPERPLMRDDLYYTGSLRRLPEYTNQDRDVDYHMNVTRVPTYYQIMQDLTKSYTVWCCHNISAGLHQLVDYTMFKSLAFNCLAICGFAIYIAFYLPYLYCKVHLEQIGAQSSATRLVQMLGLGSTFGRLSSGFIITTFPKFDARCVLSASLLVAGVSIVSMIHHSNLYFKGVCMFIHGYSIGFFVPLRSLIIVDYFGLKRLTSGTGVLILCLAFGSFLGSPVAESATSYTRNVNAPFYVCGISLLVACVSLWPMKCLNQWEEKRAERKINRGRSLLN